MRKINAWLDKHKPRTLVDYISVGAGVTAFVATFVCLVTKAHKARRCDSNGYYDEVGGYHCDAIGYSPNGDWCGECCRESCTSCPVYINNKEDSNNG